MPVAEGQHAAQQALASIPGVLTSSSTIPDPMRLPQTGPDDPRILVLQRMLVLDRAPWLASVAGLDARGWLLAVMRAVEAVGRPEFTLDDVYAHEATLAALYPGNNNVRPKIRQQLQVLRDRGWLEFNGRGHYRRT
jgi:hypothetical protein